MKRRHLGDALGCSFMFSSDATFTLVGSRIFAFEQRNGVGMWMVTESCLDAKKHPKRPRRANRHGQAAIVQRTKSHARDASEGELSVEVGAAVTHPHH
jgi:hypothetical protein